MPQSEFWPFGKGTTVDGNTDSIINEEASLLQKQLGDMEGEVKEIQMELAAMKRDRLDTTADPHRGYTVSTMEAVITNTITNDLHKRSEENKFNKISEISALRTELIRAKTAAEEEKSQRESYASKLKELEQKLNNICSVGDTKECRKFSDEEVTTLRVQVRDMKEEMEELKFSLSEKTEQLQEYRVKYLQAQQHVEELKRELDVIEFDNKQVSDQIQIEIQKMKVQFQEKLQEVAPLPDLLKGAQMQLQEARQLQRLAEDSSHQLSSELHKVKEKLVIAISSLNQEKSEKIKVIEENSSLKFSLEEQRKEAEDLQKSLDEYKCMVTRLEEKLLHQDALFKEKAAEYSQLFKDFEELREENTRSLNRCKERSDYMRRNFYSQISELERQLIQSRAQCKACQKERDDIRQRMQIQINNLQENFELVEIRLRTLQGQVNSLKNSYSVILADGEENTDLKIVST